MKKAAPPKTLAYYVTAHGFGHAVRSFEIIHALRARDPQLRIILVSDLPEFLVAPLITQGLEIRKKRVDVGLIQLDSLRFDLEASFRAVREIHRNEKVLVEEEAKFLRRERVQLLVSDIGFLPIVAASQAGIPGICVSNFTWHWIYQFYAREDPRWIPLVEWIRECYRQSTLFLRLPMHGEDPDWSEGVVDVPLVARHARLSPQEVRNILGCSEDRKVYLIAFSALELSRDALKNLEKMEETLFLFKHPLHYDLDNGRSLDPYDLLTYADVVGAVDGVITKPGYGIVSDCLVHGTPMIYTDRGAFVEYEILVREIHHHLNWAYLPSKDLTAGNWSEAMGTIEGKPRKLPNIRSDGAEVCAGKILSMAP